MKTKETYNGWKNRQTWNVALWISNDYSLYQAAVQYVKANPTKRKLYMGFIQAEGLSGSSTPDNIKWDGTKLDYARLNEFMKDLIS